MSRYRRTVRTRRPCHLPPSRSFSGRAPDAAHQAPPNWGRSLRGSLGAAFLQSRARLGRRGLPAPWRAPATISASLPAVKFSRNYAFFKMHKRLNLSPEPGTAHSHGPQPENLSSPLLCPIIKESFPGTNIGTFPPQSSPWLAYSYRRVASKKNPRSPFFQLSF